MKQANLWCVTQNYQLRTLNNQLSTITVLVTGGAGFIGSHLAEELAERGHRVIILDDLSTGKKENIAALMDSSLFSAQSPLPRREVRRSPELSEEIKERVKDNSTNSVSLHQFFGLGLSTSDYQLNELDKLIQSY